MNSDLKQMDTIRHQKDRKCFTFIPKPWENGYSAASLSCATKRGTFDTWEMPRLAFENIIVFDGLVLSHRSITSGMTQTEPRRFQLSSKTNLWHNQSTSLNRSRKCHQMSYKCQFSKSSGAEQDSTFISEWNLRGIQRNSSIFRRIETIYKGRDAVFIFDGLNSSVEDRFKDLFIWRSLQNTLIRQSYSDVWMRGWTCDMWELLTR